MTLERDLVTSHPRQIPMPIGFAESMTFENFYPGDEATLLSTCLNLVEGKGEQQVFVWGGHKTGKTHLLTACCNHAVVYGQRIAYIPANIIADDVLSGLEFLDLICIDDIQQLSETGERALFTFYNELRQNGGRLVIASDRVPSKLKLKLVDMISRLGWGPVFHLPTLNDSQILMAFDMHAKQLGINLPNEIVDFIFARQARDLSCLVATLDKLLNAAMVSKRRLTIPFVKEVLDL